MNKYNRLFSDTLLMTLGNFSSKVLIFFLLPLYTYMLTKEEYGVADLFITTVSILIPIATFSISEATFRFAFDKNVNQGENLMNSLTVIGISVLFVLIIIQIMSKWNIYFDQYGAFFLGIYVVNALNTCLTNYARGTNHVKIFVLSGIIYTGILVSANVLFLMKLKMGLYGYFYAVIIAFLGSSLFIFLSLHSWELIRLRNINIRLCKKMMLFSIPMIFSTIAWWVMNYIDKYMIIYFFGIEESALFGVAQKIPTIITVFSSIFIQAWQISAIDEYGTKDTSEFYTNIYKIYETTLYFVAAIIIFMTEPFAAFLFQKEYYSAFVFVPFLTIAGIFSCLTSFLQSAFIAAKKSNMLLYSTLIGGSVNIIANYILLIKIGTIGAVYATIISFGITWLVRFFTSKKYVSIICDWKKTFFSIGIIFTEAIAITYQVPYGEIYSLLAIVLLVIIHHSELNIVFKSIKTIQKKILQ